MRRAQLDHTHKMCLSTYFVCTEHTCSGRVLVPETPNKDDACTQGAAEAMLESQASLSKTLKRGADEASLRYVKSQ